MSTRDGIAGARTWAEEVHPHGPVVPLGERLWMVTGSLPRSPLPRNMVLFRLPGGGLLIHSPVALREENMRELEGIGRPEILVAPSARHRSHVGAFAARHPSMRICAPAAARTKVEEVSRVDATSEELLPRVGVTVHVPDGLAPSEHVLELDLAPGRALLFNDALFNIAALPGLSGALLKLLGSTGFFGMTRIGRFAMLSDRERFRGFLRGLARIPDLRVITVSHGDPIRERCAERLEEAAARL